MYPTGFASDTLGSSVSPNRASSSAPLDTSETSAIFFRVSAYRVRFIKSIDAKLKKSKKPAKDHPWHTYDRCISREPIKKARQHETIGSP